MKLLSLCAVMLGLVTGLGFAAPRPADKDDKDDAKKFLGEWMITKWEQAGFAQDQDTLDSSKWTFEKDKYIFDLGGNMEEGELKLDPKAKTPTLDLIIKTGNDAGKEQPGIYKIEGDTITVCMAMPGVKERPTEFSSTQENRQIVAVLKKKK
ncbi:MAG TPA: TIGR03067 domain-containing protein [Gemmataceae bacterium]|jgi:uncharacterized protein (TIGR03067 family)|nr:TIGR03067 domain-containing protein [Gemmataceae bacterium]